MVIEYIKNPIDWVPICMDDGRRNTGYRKFLIVTRMIVSGAINVELFIATINSDLW